MTRPGKKVRGSQDQEADVLISSFACLLAFLDSDLALAEGTRDWMALPRLMPLPDVIADLKASIPPGILRFCATCAAATHCPMVLNPPQAVEASSLVNVLIFPAMTGLWLRTSLGAAFIELACAVEVAFPLAAPVEVL